MAAPAFRLPALDQDFLLGDSTRGLRFQLEYQKAEEHLRAWGVESTVVVFGSARIRENDGSGWYEAARKFAEICSLNGGAKLDRKTAAARMSLRPAAAPASWKRQTAAPMMR